MVVNFAVPVKDMFDMVKSFIHKKQQDPTKIDLTYVDMPRCKGLVAFVSKSRQSVLTSAASTAVDFHYAGEDSESEPTILKKVWLLHTPYTKEDAEELEHHIRQREVGCECIGLDQNSDIDNASHIKNKIDQIMKDAASRDISEQEIALDITGGSVSVSLGMFAANMAYSTLLQVMIPLQKDDNGRPLEGTKSIPRKIELRNQENS